MEQKSLAYAKYWRICLADADLGKGALKRADLDKLILRQFCELQNGRVDAELTHEFFKHSWQDVDKVEVTIRPYIYYSLLERVGSSTFSPVGAYASRLAGRGSTNARIDAVSPLWSDDFDERPIALKFNLKSRGAIGSFRILDHGMGSSLRIERHISCDL